VLRTGAIQEITDFSRVGTLPTGAWDRPPSRVVALPLSPSGESGRAGVFVAGLNPYRLFDDDYRGFLELVAAQIAGAMVNAQAYEDERKRAEGLAELDRAKTAFFSNVSHEFRTPLTLLLGPLEEVLARWDPGAAPGERALMQTAHRNGLRLLKLVNTLLDFARIEGGAGEGELPPDRPPVAHGRAGLQLPVGGGADRPPLRGALPPARGAGLGGPRHVGEDRPSTSSPTPSSSPSTAGSPSSCARSGVKRC
jgi:signal transduction histidine kinase